MSRSRDDAGRSSGRPENWLERFRGLVDRQLTVEGRIGRGVAVGNRFVIGLILLDITMQVLATESTFYEPNRQLIHITERTVLSLFTLEMLLRFWAVGRHPQHRGIAGRLRWLRSPETLIDLVAILPTWFAIGGDDLTVARLLRGFRLVRFVRFGPFGRAAFFLRRAVQARGYELAVSFSVTGALLLTASVLMYFVERDANPEAFGSIPRALWWSVITMTTVGYGDATPVTAFGKLLASVVAVLSVMLIALPTGILASAFSEAVQARRGNC